MSALVVRAVAHGGAGVFGGIALATMLGCWPRGRCRWPKNDTKRLPATSASSSVEHRSGTGAPSLRSVVPTAGEKAVGTTSQKTVHRS